MNEKIKFSLFFVVFLFGSIIISAQTDDLSAYKLNALSLDQAIRYSMTHSPEYNNKKLKQQEASMKLSETYTDRIPTVYASGDIRNNLIIPSTPVPASMLDPTASADELLYMKFATRWSSSAGINLSYDLFNPATAGKVPEQKQEVKISGYNMQLSEKELRAKVSQAYAECIIAVTQMESMAQDTVYYHNALSYSETLYVRGKMELADKNKAKTAFNESIYRFLQAQTILHAAKSKLLYVMGEEITDENIQMLHFSEDIPALYAKIASPLLNDAGSAFPENSLSEMRQSEVVSLAANRIKHASWKFAPTLSLSGFYGVNYFGRELQLANSSQWLGNSFIAMSLKFPITQSLSTSRELSQLRIQKQTEQENLRDIRNKLAMDWSNETAQLMARQKEYALKQNNLSMTRENFLAARSQYDKGHLLQTDLMSEESKVRTAVQDYLQAAYNLFLSCIAIDKIQDK
ncbi:MAG: TolC family protein [Bacteroidales bacterium]|nr:TolC family protein [Bacteroidales bacterium]MDD2612017.1 TolC family protein [Bacteroidales bacterium]